MLSKDVTGLREALGYSVSELARALHVPADDVVAWESGERFPTKRAVERMQRLLAGHRAAGARQGEGASAASSSPPGATPWAALADPALWVLFRKLAASPALRERVARLAADYPDPAEAETSTIPPRPRR